MVEYTFDATITIAYDPEKGDTDPGKQAAAEAILAAASDYALAVSLHDEGSLNVKGLQDKLDQVRKYCEEVIGRDMAGDDWRRGAACVAANCLNEINGASQASSQ